MSTDTLQFNIGLKYQAKHLRKERLEVEILLGSIKITLTKNIISYLENRKIIKTKITSNNVKIQ